MSGSRLPLISNNLHYEVVGTQVAGLVIVIQISNDQNQFVVNSYINAKDHLAGNFLHSVDDLILDSYKEVIIAGYLKSIDIGNYENITDLKTNNIKVLLLEKLLAKVNELFMQDVSNVQNPIRKTHNGKRAKKHNRNHSFSLMLIPKEFKLIAQRFPVRITKSFTYSKLKKKCAKVFGNLTTMPCITWKV